MLGEKNKLYKAICNESQFTVNGEILVGYFTGDDAEYFKGTSFYWWKDEWNGGDSINFSKEDFYNAVVEYKELKFDD